ncbi:MAG: glycosyltransferase family protein [Alphaproteobacteria bacterium]
MRSQHILLHVQHLLGVGHLFRAAVLTRALVAEGLEVTVLSGGPPVAEVDFGAADVIKLPALRVLDETFASYVDDAGRPVDAAWEARRRELVLATFARLKPAALIVEMFPFGRRRLRFELLPLLDAAVRAEPRPVVVSSVRDVLTARRPDRIRETAALARQFFDAVLVHGDPTVIPFEASFPRAAEIAGRLHYTGYVAPPAPRRGRPSAPGWGEVVVSAGGGAVGEALLQAALAAPSLSGRARGRPWRLLVGRNLPDARLGAMRSAAPPGVQVARNRPDFPKLLANCAVSVSQGGYNTVVNVLNARARAVIVPFSRAGETEQLLRGERLRELGLAWIVNEARLSPTALAAAVDRALKGPRPRTMGIALDGADKAAKLVAAWAARGHV